MEPRTRRPTGRSRLRRVAMLCAAFTVTSVATTSHFAVARDDNDEEGGVLQDVTADVQELLADQLSVLGDSTPTTVMVHGIDIDAARAAVDNSGMRLLTTYDKIGVAVAKGTGEQIAVAGNQPGVTYLEGNRPIERMLETSNVATRGAEAVETLTGANGTALDGSGVSVAVIDTGIDPMHPFFRDGAVVANLRSVCLLPEMGTDCVIPVGNLIDTDTLSLGGHGTHVSGIVGGRPTQLSDGAELQGAAPGTSIVSIATGAALLVLNSDAALNWVLENHEAPCGEGVPAEECPPVKVTNNSYGSTGEFDPDSATVKLQRALAEEGVVTVWAAGNDGGDGSASVTNPPGQDPTPGIISVASYDDQGTGTRDGLVSDFSSRGDAGDPSTWPDISAPGSDITSSCRPLLVICATGLDPRNGPGLLDIGTFNTISGTSMAAPHIAGIVAQLYQANPDATPAEIEDALKSTAHQFTDGAGYTNVGGYSMSYDKGTGLVDVVAAYGAVTP